MQGGNSQNFIRNFIWYDNVWSYNIQSDIFLNIYSRKKKLHLTYDFVIFLKKYIFGDFREKIITDTRVRYWFNFSEIKYFSILNEEKPLIASHKLKWQLIKGTLS